MHEFDEFGFLRSTGIVMNLGNSQLVAYSRLGGGGGYGNFIRANPIAFKVKCLQRDIVLA